MTEASERCRVFRQLHQAGCFVMPNPWDLGSARQLVQLGFPALATTSSGFAWSLGRPDNSVSLAEALAHLRSIAHGVPGGPDAEASELMPGLVVPQKCRDTGCKRQPSAPFPWGDVVASEGMDSLCQRRPPLRVAVCDHQCQAIQQQIGRARRLRRSRRRPGGPRGFKHTVVASRQAGKEDRGERF